MADEPRAVPRIPQPRKTAYEPWTLLRVLREKDGHTQVTLGAAAGLSKQHISDLELGNRRPTPPIVRRLAEALNVPMSVLEPRRRIDDIDDIDDIDEPDTATPIGA